MATSLIARRDTAPWSLSRFDPTNLSATPLPRNITLAARLLSAAILLRGDTPFPPYLPYLEVIDAIGAPDVVGQSLRTAARVGALVVLFTPWVRAGAALAGAAFLAGLIGCRPCHSVAHTYVACVFLIVGFTEQRWGAALMRAQVVLLYLGASMNKIGDPDWWNGRYFETLMVDRHQHATYRDVAAWFPPLALSAALGIATMATQLGIAAGVLFRRTRMAALVIGILFHSVMVLLLDNTFGPFFLALLISYLAFLDDWPADRRLTVAAFAVVLLLATESFDGAVRRAALVSSLTAGAVWLIGRRIRRGR